MMLQSFFATKSSRLLSVYGYLLILLLGSSAYANTFTGTFNFDDMVAILVNPTVTKPEMFTLTHLLKGWRSVGDFTFALNYRVHGTRLFGYHAVNLAIHLTSACLVAALVRATFRTPWCLRFAPGPEERADLSRSGVLIGIFAALLFVSHPVQTQAVTYITQRYTSLATMFYLLALWLYVRARLASLPEGRRWMHVLGLALLSLAVSLLAMKTKQIAFTLPFMMILYEFFFFSGSIRNRFAILAFFLLSTFVIPLTQLTVTGNRLGIFEKLAVISRETPSMGRVDYLFTQFRVIVTYLRLLVFPANQRLDYDYPIYHTFWAMPVFCSFLLLLLMVMLALFLLRASGKSAHGEPLLPPALRLAAFGIFWFFVTLSVESSIIPIADVIVEHRIYLPSAGLFIAFVALAVTGAISLGRKHRRIMHVISAMLMAVVLLFAVLAYQRNKVWANDATLWEDNVAKEPNLARPLNNLAYACIRRNDPRRALELLVRANALSPGYTDTWLNICIALDRLGVYGDRFRYGMEMIDGQGKVMPQYLTQWFGLASNNLGLAQDLLGDHREAIKSFEQALRVLPRLPEAHFNLGVALLAMGERQRAEQELRKLQVLDPRLAQKMLLWFHDAEGKGK
jgi:tetratricopeptide (TPR) repeat protein